MVIRIRIEILELFNGLFTYFDFYREPRIKHENPRQRFELFECFLVSFITFSCAHPVVSLSDSDYADFTRITALYKLHYLLTYILLKPVDAVLQTSHRTF